LKSPIVHYDDNPDTLLKKIQKKSSYADELSVIAKATTNLRERVNATADSTSDI
jgi:hypothetical protein